MAASPPVDLPAWAPWAALTALALLAALVAGVGSWLRRLPLKGDRTTVWGHLHELRRRLVRIVLALVAGVGIAFLVRLQSAPPWLGIDPYDNLAAQVFRRMAADLVPSTVDLVVTRPTDGFVAIFDAALGLGILLTLPYLLAQIGGFFLPALRPRERKMLAWMVLPTLLLFLVGALFAYLIVLPAAYQALYTFSAVLGAKNFLDVNEFMGFTLMFLVLSGAAFQTPLVMYALARVGVTSPRAYLHYWRHVIVAIVIVAGLVTPDPTPVSQLLVAGPLVGLYFLGIALSVGARRAFERSQA